MVFLSLRDRSDYGTGLVNIKKTRCEMKELQNILLLFIT